jgi:hypothetical protein
MAAYYFFWFTGYFLILNASLIPDQEMPESGPVKAIQ